jgi:hypothetical protein
MLCVLSTSASTVGTNSLLQECAVSVHENLIYYYLYT